MTTRSTRDALFGGKVSLAQPARGDGYRVNVDALLLADFAARTETSRVKTLFDLGAGVGAVALGLLYRDAVVKAVLVELDGDAAALAMANLDANGWSARAEVIRGDVLAVARAHRGEATLVTCNPPYFAPGRGRVASVPARARARSGELGSFVDAARMLLGRRGRACFVYPARELVALLESLRACGLEPKRLRMVRATAEDAARVVLVEAMAAKPGGLLVEGDCIEREGGAPSKELTRIMAGLAARG